MRSYMAQVEKTLPLATSVAEKAVLGSILRSPEQFDIAMTKQPDQ